VKLPKLRPRGTRDSLSTPSEDLIAAFGGQQTYSGKTVTVSNALHLVPVFRAVTLLAGAVGSLPLEVYRRTADSRKQPVSMTSRPWELLHDKPNELMAADEMHSLVMSHLATWGNAFLWKERGSDGRIAHLWPIDPRRVQVGRSPDAKPAFLVQTYGTTPPGQDYFAMGPSVVVGSDELLHIRGLSQDGLIGYSPVQLARQMLGGMMSQEEFEGRLWANDATPGVVLVHPNRLAPEAVDRLRALWDNRHKGPSRARATAVLGEGVQVKQMTMPLEDAQFIETAKFHRTDVALLFGIPPYMLAADTGSSMTYSNSETQSLDFVKWSARSWMVRMESAYSWDPDLMPTNWYAKFCLNELLRGSMQERFQAYTIAKHLLVDEIRDMEDMEPLPDGKGQVLAFTIGPPRGTTIPTQDQPLADQPTPGEGEPVGDVPTAPTPDGGTTQGA
jgi:HK97 family phage portal protein